MNKGSLANIDAADRALTLASSLDDILQIRDQAEAFKSYAKAQRQSLEIQNKAGAIKLKAERKAGELLKKMPKAKGELKKGQNSPRSHDVTAEDEVPENNDTPTLADLGISKMESHRWQKEAEVSEEDFQQLVTTCNEEKKELTQSLLLSVAGAGHVSSASGENEWYTPPQYIEAARAVMGGIDLDPASSDVAQKIVKAKKYYTIDQDGLAKDWSGRVWLNPPYSKDLITLFTGKLADGVYNNAIEQAILLVNNATDTAWFHGAAPYASAACFIQGRISFLDRDSKPSNKPLQGQVALYYGENVDAFVERFTAFGTCFLSAVRFPLPGATP